MSLSPVFPESCTPVPVSAMDPRCKDLHRPLAPDFSWVLAACRIAWPIKTAEHLQHVTGASLRTCKYWLAGDFEPSGLAAIRLLRAVRQQLAEHARRLDLVDGAVGG